MKYFIDVGQFRPAYKEISFKEAQRAMGSLRYGHCHCANGCCDGIYNNLAEFAGRAKEMGHKRIFLNPEGPDAYAE